MQVEYHNLPQKRNTAPTDKQEVDCNIQNKHPSNDGSTEHQLITIPSINDQNIVILNS